MADEVELIYNDAMTKAALDQLVFIGQDSAGTPTGFNPTHAGSKALILNSAGKLALSTVTDAELATLSGIDSDVQAQLDAKLDSDDSALTGDTTIELVKIGTVSNYTEFEEGGMLKFVGSATVWKDLIINASNLRPGTSAPAFEAISGGIFATRFDAATGDEIHGSTEIQHDYKEGTDLQVHVHWCPATTGTGNVVFVFDYVLAGDGGVLAGGTLTMTATATPAVANKMMRTDIGAAISGVNRKIGDIIHFRFSRLNGGADTYVGGVFVSSIGIHYEVDTVGSRTITAK